MKKPKSPITFRIFRRKTAKGYKYSARFIAPEWGVFHTRALPDARTKSEAQTAAGLILARENLSTLLAA